MRKTAQDVNIAGLLQGVIQQLIHKYSPETTGTQTQMPPESSSFGGKVLSLAQADLGVHEDLGKNDGKRIREYFRYFNMGGGQDWCAAAVSAWMKEAGGGPVAGSVGARNIGKQFEQANKWVPKDKITPAAMTPGNIVVWARGGPDSWMGHVGVLESFDGKSGFTSIEANSGPRSDAVVRNTHSINDGNLLGIGILSDSTPKQASINDLISRFCLKY